MQVIFRMLRLIACAIVMASATMSLANAQQSQPPKSQTPAVSEFLANPDQLLQQYPNGGPPLSNAVQELALADPATFKVLVGLAAKGNDLQKSALGIGLAQATKIEVLTNQRTAAEWQALMAAITDPTFKTAATNALGDVQLGAVGGGPLGGAGGGPTTPLNLVTNTGPLQNIQSTPIVTPLFTSTASTSGASSPGTPLSP
jgi:hypothetical protein